MPSDEVAYCCTVHNEQDVIYWHLLYYYTIGVRNFFIQFNSADDLTRILVRKFMQDYPYSEVTVRTRSDWDRSYEGFPARKMIMYEWARDEGFEWVLPLDADELITLQDMDKREDFNIVTYLNETFPDAEPNQYIKFPAYDFFPTLNDDWFDPNPFDRIRARDKRLSTGKVIWRCGRDSTIFRGAHNVVGGDKALRSDVRPMTAHYPLRSPWQVINKKVAFAQAATHSYACLPNLDSMPDPDYGKYAGVYTGKDVARSKVHQYGKAMDGVELLDDLKMVESILDDAMLDDWTYDPVWRSTVGGRIV